MHYQPNTDADRRRMLEVVGVPDAAALFSGVPEAARCRSFALPAGLTEQAALRRLEDLAGRNALTLGPRAFMGGGIYEHFIPPAVDNILQRGDFFTAYTPYQAEVSQGTLQAIFEFQTIVTELAGLPVASASHYDGATALAAACEMALQEGGRKRNRLLLAPSVNPRYREVASTQFGFRSHQARLETVPASGGRVDLARLEAALDATVAGIVVQSPNYFGLIEDLPACAALARKAGALLVVSANPVSLGLLHRPGDVGADICCGEAQPLGVPASFGGPAVGFIACSEKLIRKIPGRIVGRAVDVDGKPGYTLTLQAREQHIRRDKASSNICSNQALCALAVTVHTAILGGQGLARVAEACVKGAHYAADRLAAAGFRLPFAPAPFFHEFVVDLGRDAAAVFRDLAARHGIAPGIPLGGLAAEFGSECANWLLVCVTETKTGEDVDRLVAALKEACRS